MAHEHDPLDHVLDDGKWVFFENLFGEPIEIALPKFYIPGYGEFQVTRFMLLQLIAGAIVLAIFLPLSRRIRQGGAPKGKWWNLIEGMLTFVRDEIVKPNLHGDTDRYMPLLWTMFFFILVCNLLGMVPFFGAPTASIFMTAGLALFSLTVFHLGAVLKLGAWGYLKSLWPHIEIVPFPLAQASGDHGHGHDEHAPVHHDQGASDTPRPTGIKLMAQLLLWAVSFVFCNVVSLMIFAIEFGGTFMKSGVLALRLFVNMFAGHVVMAALLLMIVVAGTAESGEVELNGGWWITMPISVLAVSALSLLELFVAFLQAYVFTFLTALFLGLALHPSH